MQRVVIFALVFMVAIGCSKSKPAATEPVAKGGDPKPGPKTETDPISIPVRKIEKPDVLPPATLAEIKKTFAPLKGKVEYSNDINYLYISFSSTKIAPGTLKSLAPYAKYLSSLALMNCEVSDTELQSLPELPWLSTLTLQHSKGFTDAGLQKLPPLMRLTALELMNTPITDAGLAELVGLTSLDSLGLIKTAITDAGLKHLAPLSNLKVLRLEQTKVTGSGLKDLASLKKLQSLNLNETPVTDAGLANLPPLPELSSISLNKTAIGDAGLKILRTRAPKIGSLDLQDTQVTDAGVGTLTSMSLFRVDLRGSRVTKQGIDAIKAKFPKCYVGGP